MRKNFLSIIILCTFALALIACGQKQEEPKKNTSTKAEKIEYKNLEAPKAAAESTATGEVKPSIVETKYETRNVIVADVIPTEMGYAVDPTGKTDSTAGLQQALNDVFDAGGGTVYLPAGNYAITDSIYIPSYVTLQGEWQDPDVGTEYGTIISVWMEPEDTDTDGTIKLGSCACASGLTIYYPKQTLDCIMPYPPTFYIAGYEPDTRCSTIRDVTMINSYRGIEVSKVCNHEQLQVANVKGTYLKYGLYDTNESEVGTCVKYKVSPKYWAEAAADCMNAEPFNRISSYMEQYTTGLLCGDIEWSQFQQLDIEHCAIGIHVIEGVRISFTASMYDVSIRDCKKGFVVDYMDERWGMNLAKAYIEGGIYNNTNAKIKMCDVEVKGKIYEKNEGSIMKDDSDLSEYNVELDKYHKLPKKNLIVAELSDGLFNDCSDSLQKALDSMAAQGGGIVYVPGGSYRFYKPITVPANVELRGTATSMTRDIKTLLNGTVFLCYYGDDKTSKPEDTAFITLSGENAGINGIRITYPENGGVSAHRQSTYTIRGKASGVYFENSCLSGMAWGVDFSNCDNHYIGMNNTICYNNTYRVGGKNGTIIGCLQNNSVMYRTSNLGLVDWCIEGVNHNIIMQYQKENCDYIIIENGENELITNVNEYSVHLSIKNINSKNTLICNIGNDVHYPTSPQLEVDGGDVVGINFMRCNGYSYELIKGRVALYNRIAISEVGEKTSIREK